MGCLSERSGFGMPVDRQTKPGELGAGAMAAEGAETAPLKDGLMMVHDCLWLIMVHNINQNGSFMVCDCL